MTKPTTDLSQPGCDVLLTSEEVAEYFQVHPKTVQRWRRMGKLTAASPASRPYRFRASQLPPREEATHLAKADDRLLRRAEVAALYRISPKTVTKWANTGILTAVLTPGGRRRYPESLLPNREVFAAANGQGTYTARKTRGLLTPDEAAKLIGVDRRQVIRWMDSGRISTVLTPTGFRRIRRRVALATARARKKSRSPASIAAA